MSRCKDPELPVPLGIYAAAFTIALTTTDEDERRGAVWLMREIGGETFGVRELRRKRGRRSQHSKPVGHNVPLKRLIREVLEERLSV